MGHSAAQAAPSIIHSNNSNMILGTLQQYGNNVLAYQPIYQKIEELENELTEKQEADHLLYEKLIAHFTEKAQRENVTEGSSTINMEGFLYEPKKKRPYRKQTIKRTPMNEKKEWGEGPKLTIYDRKYLEEISDKDAHNLGSS